MNQPVPAAGPTRGTLLVVGLLGLAVALGAFALWFQWRQTQGCLRFFGPEVARAIQAAPRVELWTLSAPGGRPSAGDVLDVSRAPGLVHLRRGLIEDVNYRWDSAPMSPLPPDAWEQAIAFFPDATGDPAAVLAVDLDDGGWLTVVGRPGRLALGRLRGGLATWLDATRKAAVSPR